MDTSKPLLYGSDILTGELPELQWVIKNLLAEKDRAVLAGEFGAGKSWVVAHMGISIAAGMPWLKTFEVPKPRGVVYIDEENPIVTTHRRAKRLMMGLGVTKEQVEKFAIYPRGGLIFRLGESEQLVRYLEERAPWAEILIIDAMRRVLDGSENASEAVIEMWRRIEVLIKHGYTVLLVHHMNKPPREGEVAPRHRISGSTDIGAGGDVIYTLNGDGTGGFVTLQGEKSRNMTKSGKLHLHWHDDGDLDGPMYIDLLPEEEEQSGASIWGS